MKQSVETFYDHFVKDYIFACKNDQVLCSTGLEGWYSSMAKHYAQKIQEQEKNQIASFNRLFSRNDNEDNLHEDDIEVYDDSDIAFTSASDALTVVGIPLTGTEVRHVVDVSVMPAVSSNDDYDEASVQNLNPVPTQISARVASEEILDSNDGVAQVIVVGARVELPALLQPHSEVFSEWMKRGDVPSLEEIERTSGLADKLRFFLKNNQLRNHSDIISPGGQLLQDFLKWDNERMAKLYEVIKKEDQQKEEIYDKRSSTKEEDTLAKPSSEFMSYAQMRSVFNEYIELGGESSKQALIYLRMLDRYEYFGLTADHEDLKYSQERAKKI